MLRRTLSLGLYPPNWECSVTCLCSISTGMAKWVGRCLEIFVRFHTIWLPVTIVLVVLNIPRIGPNSSLRRSAEAALTLSNGHAGDVAYTSCSSCFSSLLRSIGNLKVHVSTEKTLCCDKSGLMVWALTRNLDQKGIKCQCSAFHHYRNIASRDKSKRWYGNEFHPMALWKQVRDGFRHVPEVCIQLYWPRIWPSVQSSMYVWVLRKCTGDWRLVTVSHCHAATSRML